MKTVFVFVGPKGSGKSYLCGLIESVSGIKYVDSEKLFMSVQHAGVTEGDNIEKGYQLVEHEILKLLKDSDSVTLDSTGAAGGFWDMMKRIEQRADVKLISVSAPEELCIQRIRERDGMRHIEIEEDSIRKINRISSSVEFDYAFKVETDKFDRDLFFYKFMQLKNSKGKY